MSFASSKRKVCIIKKKKKFETKNVKHVLRILALKSVVFFSNSIYCSITLIVNAKKLWARYFYQNFTPHSKVSNAIQKTIKIFYQNR